MTCFLGQILNSRMTCFFGGGGSSAYPYHDLEHYPKNPHPCRLAILPVSMQMPYGYSSIHAGTDSQRISKLYIPSATQILRKDTDVIKNVWYHLCNTNTIK